MKLIFVFSLIIPCYCVNVAINWSLATGRDDEYKERLYLHPAYDNVAPSTCDLTPNYCDVNCCSDPDCTYFNKQTFNCKIEETSFKFPELDCRYDGYFKHFWFPLLCSTYQNTAYLGQFFKTLPKIQELSKLKQLGLQGFSFKPGLVQIKQNNKTYSYGEDIKMFLNKEDDKKIMFTKLNLNGHCVEAPVKFLINYNSTCLTEIKIASCETNLHLSLNSILITNVMGEINSFANVKTEVCVKHVQNSLKTSVTGKFLYYSHKNLNVKCLNNSLNHMKTLFNQSSVTCENVLLSSGLKFLWNGTKIIKLEVELIVGNVQLLDKDKTLLIQQNYFVKFQHVQLNMSVDIKDEFKRGYNVGEKINFGFLRTDKNKDESEWIGGHLKMFVNALAVGIPTLSLMLILVYLVEISEITILLFP